MWSCYGCGATGTALFYTTFWVPGGIIDQDNWVSPKLQAWYKDYTVTGNPKYLHDINVYITTDALAVQIAQVDSLLYYSPKLTGVSLSTARAGSLRIREWKSKS